MDIVLPPDVGCRAGFIPALNAVLAQDAGPSTDWRRTGLSATFPLAGMSSLCVSMMMLLLVAPAGPTATNAGAPAETTRPAASSDRAERTARAAEFFEGGRYVEAALEFEALRRDYPDEPSILFNAAASRDAAGHFAHAVAYVREYLGRTDIGPDDRKQGEEQLAEAARKVTPVTVTVTLPLEGPQTVTVVARHVSSSPADLRPELSFPLPNPRQSLKLELDPGAWSVRVEGSSYQSAEQQVAVGSAPLAISLRPVLAPVVRPEPPQARMVPPEVVKGTARGLYIGGGAMAAVGLGLIGGGVGMIHGQRVKACDDPTLADCRRRFASAFVVRNVGSTLLGAGAGLAASALVWRANDARQRMIAWSALAAVGGVGLILGEVMVVRGSIPFSRDNTNPEGTLAGWSEHWREHRHSALPALGATLRGLGVGLLAGAVTGLIVQRKHLGPGGARAIRVDPSAGPGHTGIVLSGRF
ncbi:hypothetical protein OV203_28320 [Nannocystis sp. ILAH1]|uniref:hypothetical protein n=1 Tax=Nannocystis sp. ILAH1 TaxID=2996789 RepID=UPI002271A4BA|nr:hypothetical protein [Nannocystis sp. ILAH1]MCY0991083.1 hypothetical protein [Nannocystis sp. ILAH1]